MVVGIVGLGLIGGSFAKAYKADKNWKVLASNRSKEIVEIAKLDNKIDDELTDENIGECDLVIIGLYPQATIDYVKKNAKKFKKGAFVIDTCGTKRKVCKALFPIAKKNGFTYIGGHPMAGRHFSGYKHSLESLFKGSSMIVVLPDYNDIELNAKIKELLAPAGFEGLTITTAEEHDKIVAFTSQLAHVVSNAYIKSPTASSHRGFSAGSYKDLTRVAWLNEIMWTELFMENRDNLVFELDTIIDSLSKYRDALKNEDEKQLEKLLLEGKNCKEADLKKTRKTK